MIPGKNGYIPSEGKLDDDLAAMSDLQKAGMPEFEVIQFSPLLDSSNVSVVEWNKMGQIIAENYDRFDGFVILHGTDTMSYSASALSFMLENLVFLPRRSSAEKCSTAIMNVKKRRTLLCIPPNAIRFGQATGG